MNNDLISRSALVKRFEDAQQNMSKSVLEVVFFDAVLGMVDNAPTIDAEPVRLRIDTIEVDAEKGWYRKLFYCRCDRLIKVETWDKKYCFGHGTVIKENVMPKYCPFCGAKMDQEVEG